MTDTLLKPNSKCFGTHVRIFSGERGIVAGYAQYQRTKVNQFYVEYVDGNGCAREAWFFADQLTVVSG